MAYLKVSPARPQASSSMAIQVTTWHINHPCKRTVSQDLAIIHASVAVRVWTLPPYQPITTGTVTDSGSECTDFISDIAGYIYRTGELWSLAGWPSTWLECWLTEPGPMCSGVGERWGEGCELRDSGSAGCGLACCYKLISFYLKVTKFISYSFGQVNKNIPMYL